MGRKDSGEFPNFQLRCKQMAGPYRKDASHTIFGTVLRKQQDEEVLTKSGDNRHAQRAERRRIRVHN